MILDDLRKAINDGKNSGTPTPFTIKYSIRDIDIVFTEGGEKLPGTEVTKDFFRVEVQNAFAEWEAIFRLYQRFLTLEFSKVESGDDITIAFDSTASNPSSFNDGLIKINPETAWYTMQVPRANRTTYPLLNRLIFHIGTALGLPDTIKGADPMSRSYLKEDYEILLGININNEGGINPSFLDTFSTLRLTVSSTYGTFNSPVIFYLPTIAEVVDTNINPSLQGFRGYFESSPQFYLSSKSGYYTITDGVLSVTNNIKNLQGTTTSISAPETPHSITSLVITDKGISEFTDYTGDATGNIKYYILIGTEMAADVQAGGGTESTPIPNIIKIYNSHGNEVSTPPDIGDTVIGLHNTEYYNRLNITYEYSGDTHTLSWYTSDGKLKKVVLNDTLHQTTSTGDTSVNCASDTLSYGNVESSSSFDFLTPYYYNLQNDIYNKTLKVEDGKIQPSVDYLGVKGVSYDYNHIGPPGPSNRRVQGYGAHLNPSREAKIGAGDSVEGKNITVLRNINNRKGFVIPTVNGNIYAGFDLFSNILRVTKGAPLISGGRLNTVVWLGDHKNHLDDTYRTNPAKAISIFDEKVGAMEADEIVNIELGGTFRNTKLDVSPFNLGDLDTILLRPFSQGFSFDSFDYSIFSMFELGWSNTTRLFDKTIDGTTLLNAENTTINGYNTNIKRYASLPVTIGNKLLEHNLGDTRLSYRIVSEPATVLDGLYAYYDEDLHNSPNKALQEKSFIGAFHLATAVRHGFILFKIHNTNFSLLSPTTEEGIELHVPGGDFTMVDAGGGWTPIAMQFSPDDNYLYTIIENPADSSQRKIAIYPINQGSAKGCMAADGKDLMFNVIIVDNKFAGNLTKITLQDDGAIYIWSDAGEYHKIPAPDLSYGVESFSERPDKFSIESFEYLPSSSLTSKALDTSKLTIDSTSFKSADNEDSRETDARIVYSKKYSSTVPPVDSGAGVPDLVSPDFVPVVITPGIIYNTTTYTTETTTENSSALSAASAIQTAKDVSNNIILYADYLSDENGERLSIKDSEGAILEGGSIATSYGGKEFDSPNSLFILPTNNIDGEYVVGFIDSKENEPIYKYKIVQIDYQVGALGTKLSNPYRYKLTDAAVLVSSVAQFSGTTASAMGVKNCIGIGVIKDVKNYNNILVTANINTKKVLPENGREVSITITKNTIANLSFKKTAEDILFNTGKGYVAHEHGKDNYTFGANALSGDTNAVITFSKDLKFVAIGTSSEVDSVMTLSIHTFDITTLEMTPVGAPINYNRYSGSGGGYLNNPKIRSMEFSPNNSVLYVLTGNRLSDWGMSEEDYTPSILDMSEYNQSVLTAVTIDTDANTVEAFGEVRHATSYELTDGNTRKNANRSGAGELFTATGSMSDAGNPSYTGITNMLYLSRTAAGFLNIINSYAKTTEVEGETIFIQHISGVITTPDDINNATTIPTVNVVRGDSLEETSHGGGGSRGVPTNHEDWYPPTLNEYEDNWPHISQSAGGRRYGCMDPEANNFNPNATRDDGSCTYEGPIWENQGTCTNPVSDIDWNNPNLNPTFEAALVAAGAEVIDNHLSGNDIWKVFNPNTAAHGNCGGNSGAKRHNIINVYPIKTTVWRNEECDDHCHATFTLRFKVESRAGSGHGACHEFYTYVEAVFTYRTAPPSTDAANYNLPLLAGEPGSGYSARIYSINLLSTPSGEYNVNYCKYCLNSDSDDYSGITPSECHSPYCIDTPSLCGIPGCTDGTACNYNSEANIDDDSCIFPKEGCECFEGSVQPSADWCGDCSMPGPSGMWPSPGETCDCDGKPKASGTGHGEYYCGCDGELPSIEATSAGCACNFLGELKLEDGYSGIYQNGYCDCYGTQPVSSRCDCEGKVKNATEYCDCDTDVQTYYPDPDGNGYASCELPYVRICPKEGTSDYIDILTDTTITASELEDNYIEGPYNAVDCEECATDEGATAEGFTQEYNCEGKCKIKVANAATSFGPFTNILGNPYYLNLSKGEVYTDPNWVATIENNCGECILPDEDPTDCCDTDSDGNAIVDACGSCLNKVDIGQFSVTDLDDGTFWITKFNTPTDKPFEVLNCSPCSELSPNETFSGSAFNTKWEYIKEKYITDGCQICGTASYTLDETDGRFQGYYTAEIDGTKKIKCTCQATAFIAPSSGVLDCCDGYQYDECRGKCISMSDNSLQRDCNGGCQNEDSTFTYSWNGCGDCTVGGAQTYNSAGCCGNQVVSACANPETTEGENIVVIGACYDPEFQPIDDPCGICEGDGSTCSGCTDEAATNYNPTAAGASVDCNYYDLYDLTTDISGTVDGDGQVANKEAAFWMAAPKSKDLSQISEGFKYDTNLGAYIDTPDHTTKCQVIGKNNNTTLYITNPKKNAEIDYTDKKVIHTSLHEGLSTEGYLSKYSARYYFRVAEGIVLQSEVRGINIKEVFREYGDKITHIKDVYGEIYLPEWDFGTFDIISGRQDSLVTDTSEVHEDFYPYHIYEVKPKIDPATGHPYEFIIDFGPFIYTSYPGCMDAQAINYNPLANEDDSSCEYAVVTVSEPTPEPEEPPVVVETFDPNGYLLVFINHGDTDMDQLRWVIYNHKNQIALDYTSGFANGFDNSPARVFKLDSHVVGELLDGCSYFIPIGFKYNDNWKNIKILVLKNKEVLKSISYGAEYTAPRSIDNRGTFILKKGVDTCDVSCYSPVHYNYIFHLDIPGKINIVTDFCTKTIKKDVNEFTDIIFKAEFGAETFDSQYSDNSNQTKDIYADIEIIDLDTGKTLKIAARAIESLGESYTTELSIDKKTRLGIKVKTNTTSAPQPFKFSLTSEFGEVIKIREYKKRMGTEKTFDAITISPGEEGCVDPAASNYNPDATINSKICFNSEFEKCIQKMLFSVRLRDCNTTKSKQALKAYAIYEGYKQAVRESNQTKIDIYSQQLADMCNAEYCKSC